MEGNDEQMADSPEGEAPKSASAQTTLNEGLQTRLKSAVLLVPASLLFVWLGGWPFTAVLMVVAGFMAFEWVRLILGKDHQSKLKFWVALYTVFGAAVLTLGHLGHHAASLSLTGLTTVLFYVLASRQNIQPRWMASGVVYFFLPMASFIWLRAGVDGGWGIEVIVWLLFVVWGSDSGGYIIGKSVGGPKLAPRVSPNKTWSGFVGGLVFAMTAGLVASLLIGQGSVLALILVSAGLSAISQIGDLVESSVKRHFGVKDFSNLIPGHGGVLDRFDGLLFVLMAAGILQIFHGGPLLIWN